MPDHGILWEPSGRKGEKIADTSFAAHCQSLREAKKEQEKSYADIESITGRIVSIDTIRRIINGSHEEQRIDNICLVSYALGVRLPYTAPICDMEISEVATLAPDVLDLQENGVIHCITDGQLLLGRWIRFRRETKGWTQQELAVRAKLARRTVVAVEQGKTGSTYDTMGRIAQALESRLPDVIPLTQDKVTEIIQAAVKVYHNGLNRVQKLNFPYD